jgi:hypothetical protein
MIRLIGTCGKSDSLLALHYRIAHIHQSNTDWINLKEIVLLTILGGDPIVSFGYS